MDGQATAAPEADIDSRILSALGGEPPKEEENAEPVEPSEEPQEEAEQEEEAQEEEGEEEPKEPEAVDWDAIKDAKVKVKVQGEESEVTLEEARLGYMRTADYQKKTAELSQQRTEVATQARQVVEETQMTYAKNLQTLDATVQRLMAPEMADVNWHQLAAENPAEYVRLSARMGQINQVRQAISEELGRIDSQRVQEAQARHAQAIQQGVEELKTRIPDYGPDVEKALYSAGEEYGFTKEQLASVIDPKLLHVLNDARKWRELQTKKPLTEKRVSEAPKVMKPGAKADPRAQREGRTQDLRERIRKSGGKDDAALEAFIKRSIMR
jgi:hypothetical protein